MTERFVNFSGEIMQYLGDDEACRKHFCMTHVLLTQDHEYRILPTIFFCHQSMIENVPVFYTPSDYIEHSLFNLFPVYQGDFFNIGYFIVPANRDDSIFQCRSSCVCIQEMPDSCIKDFRVHSKYDELLIMSNTDDTAFVLLPR